MTRPHWTDEQYAAHNARIRSARPQIGLVGRDQPVGGPTQPDGTIRPVAALLRSLDVPTLYRLPWPPTVNHSSGQARNGGRYLTPAHHAFRAAVAAIVGPNPPKLAYRIGIEILLQAPDRRRYDLDNRLKAVQDALVRAGAIRDDFLIDRLVVRRGPPVPGGVCHVAITQEPSDA